MKRNRELAGDEREWKNWKGIAVVIQKLRRTMRKKSRIFESDKMFGWELNSGIVNYDEWVRGYINE
jgi:hypothetical protein